MGKIERLLTWISSRLPKKTIGGECFKARGPLMHRYEVLRTRWFNVYLHNFLRSDADRHRHDHPWSFVSIVLAGSYIEHTPTGESLRKRFSVARHPATWEHWVEVDKPMWTLIFVSKKSREWGFSTEKGWIWWREYEAEFPGVCDE